MSGIRVEVDPRTAELLLGVYEAEDEPTALVAAANIDPDEFERFLAETGQLDDPAAMELLSAARGSRALDGPHSAGTLLRHKRQKRSELIDFLDILQQFQDNPDLIDRVLRSLPAAGRRIERMVKQRKLVHYRAIVSSMTPQERNAPLLIRPSQMKRIAKGSGRPLSEVVYLLQEFRTTRMIFRLLKSRLAGNTGPPRIPRLKFSK